MLPKRSKAIDGNNVANSPTKFQILMGGKVVPSSANAENERNVLDTSMLQSPNAGQQLPPINEESEEDILRTQELLKKDCTKGISSTPCSTPNLSQDYSSLLDDEFLKDDFDESTAGPEFINRPLSTIIGIVIATKIEKRENFVLLGNDHKFFLVKIPNLTLFNLATKCVDKAISVTDCQQMGASGASRCKGNIQRVASGINVNKSKAPDITILVYRYLYPSKFIASLKKTPMSCLLVDEMHCRIAEVQDIKAITTKHVENVQIRTVIASDDSDTIAVTFWWDFSTDALLVEGSSVKLTNLKISQCNYHNKVEVKLQTLPHSTISASTRTFPKLSLHSIKDFSKTYDIIEFFLQTFKPYTGCPMPTCNLKHVHYLKSRALHRCPICNLDWKIKDLHWATTIRLCVRKTGSNTAKTTECLCFTESLLLLADLKLVSWFEGKMYETVISEIFCFNNYTNKGKLCCKEKEKYFIIHDVVQKTLIA